MKRLIGLGIVLVGLLGIALLPSQGEAGGCFKNRSFYGGYQSSYVAPTYSYAQSYYVPKVVEAVVAPDYYYSVGSYYRDKILADAIVGRIAELQLKQGNPNPPIPGTQIPQNPGLETPNPMGGIKPQQQEQGKIPGAYQNQKLLTVVTQSCARCHNEGKASGGLILLSQGQLANLNSAEWNECFIQVSTQEMPKGGKALSDAETVLFREASLFTRASERQVRR